MELEVGAVTCVAYGAKALIAFIQEAYVQGISTRFVDVVVKAIVIFMVSY